MQGPDADPEEVAHTIVLRLLATRARTRDELMTALSRRHIPAEAAEAVLDRMTDVGLVNDEEFARSWVDSRQQRRHLSRTALRQELRRKGVDRDLVDEVVNEVSGDDERTAALALAERKLRSLRGHDPLVQRRRLAGALARRGFSGETVSAVLREVLNDENAVDAEAELP